MKIYMVYYRFTGSVFFHEENKVTEKQIAPITYGVIIQSRTDKNDKAFLEDVEFNKAIIIIRFRHEQNIPDYEKVDDLVTIDIIEAGGSMMHNRYLNDYQRKIGDGKQRPINCPNCGAILKSNICDYCKSIIW